METFNNTKLVKKDPVLQMDSRICHTHEPHTTNNGDITL